MSKYKNRPSASRTTHGGFHIVINERTKKNHVWCNGSLKCSRFLRYSLVTDGQINKHKQNFSSEQGCGFYLDPLSSSVCPIKLKNLLC